MSFQVCSTQSHQICQEYINQTKTKIQVRSFIQYKKSVHSFIVSFSTTHKKVSSQSSHFTLLVTIASLHSASHNRITSLCSSQSCLLNTKSSNLSSMFNVQQKYPSPFIHYSTTHKKVSSQLLFSAHHNHFTLLVSIASLHSACHNHIASHRFALLVTIHYFTLLVTIASAQYKVIKSVKYV
jgi:hypothetical protein